MTPKPLLPCCLAVALVACDGGKTASPVDAPGPPTSLKTRALDAGAALLQSRLPVDALNAYLDGFHFYSGQPGQQMEAHHYCSELNEALTQCVIFDGNQRDAKIMGVEYIVSAALFATLPAEEKRLWHSHVHEVHSGQLVAPGIPAPAEHALMQRLVSTYGKTWHTWHTDLQQSLPLGVPQLMMGFTADGQADPAMVAARDRRLGVDSAEKRQARADLPSPPVDPQANGGQATPFQIADPTGHVHAGQRAATQRALAGAPPDAAASNAHAASR
ncbi:MAG TPA: OBAP family protein [Ideonella sp.]|uniref:OBAP family protein n=1 Tax=Ideonella sp. TaxID=1929293 RepID=UPI002C91CCD6|nr:OBAP family protein [Ideonella sp.]HSI49465.1 OBAP family protein [Ideonella sp.]